MTALSPYWKVTSSGRAFDFLNPSPRTIEIEVIAHELAMTNRWGGNLELPYSVAQHSMIVADGIARPDWRIYGLLHDAGEAYIGDIISPLKALIATDFDIHGLERRILHCVWDRFGLTPPRSEVAEAVDIADMRALATEYRDLVKSRHPDWLPQGKPFSAPIRPMSAPDAEAAFLAYFSTYLGIAKAGEHRRRTA